MLTFRLLGCDIFEYNGTDGKCRFFPHTPLKDLPWAKFATESADSNISMFVMTCDDGLENVLPNNDYQHLPSHLWKTVQTSCSGPESVLLNDGIALDENPSVYHGGHSTSRRFTCHDGGEIVTETTPFFSSFPGGVGQAYFDAVKPSAMVQVWVTMNEPTSSNNHRAELRVGSAATQSFILPTPTLRPWHLSLLVENLSELVSTQDGISLTITSGGEDVEATLSPMELLTDLPKYVGCFSGKSFLLDPDWTHH